MLLKSAFIPILCRNTNIKCISRLSHTESKVLVKGKSINYVRVGAADHGCDKAVLLMPGALGSGWAHFEQQIAKLPALLPNRTIIAWDPPGYGRSIPPKRTFPIDFYRRDANDAYDLMQELGFHRYSVVGYSDGGSAAMILAANHPDVVDKIVVWGASSYILPEEVKIYKSIRDIKEWTPDERLQMIELYGKERFAQLWSDWVDGYARLGNATPDGNICKEDLPKIQAQTLIIHGAKDPLLPAEHVSYLLENIKRAEYFEFPDGKHSVQYQYSDEFNKVVADFILNKGK